MDFQGCSGWGGTADWVRASSTDHGLRICQLCSLVQLHSLIWFGSCCCRAWVTSVYESCRCSRSCFHTRSSVTLRKLIDMRILQSMPPNPCRLYDAGPTNRQNPTNQILNLKPLTQTLRNQLFRAFHPLGGAACAERLRRGV